MTALTIAQLENMTLKELYSLARDYKVSYYSKLTKNLGQHLGTYWGVCPFTWCHTQTASCFAPI